MLVTGEAANSLGVDLRVDFTRRHRRQQARPHARARARRAAAAVGIEGHPLHHGAVLVDQGVGGAQMVGEQVAVLTHFNGVSPRFVALESRNEAKRVNEAKSD